MGIGVGTLITGAWRANRYAAGYVEVVPANFGHIGSRTHWRDRRFDTIVAPVSGADPRAHRYNGLLPIVWRLRVLDSAKLAAVEARSPRPFGQPVAFTPPRTASLIAAAAQRAQTGSLK